MLRPYSPTGASRTDDDDDDDNDDDDDDDGIHYVLPIKRLRSLSGSSLIWAI